MIWEINFINEENFRKHVRETIEKYGERLKPFNLREFNKNVVDPIKMIFDKNIYGVSWEEMIKNEIFRQRDKSNNNAIGYFHQNLFSYIKNCQVPKEGWDVVYENVEDIPLFGEKGIKRVYVEMKNKHNTMNSAAAGKIYIKMQNQLLKDDECACFLVEAIAKKSQNIKWKTTIDKVEVGHKRIRRVSMDEFFSLVTGEKDAFYKICKVLPKIIKDVINNREKSLRPKDTVTEELRKMIEDMEVEPEDTAIHMALYILGFGSYNGFKKLEMERE